MVENESVDSSLSASGEKVTPKKVKIHCPYNNPEDLLVDVDKLSLSCERFRQHFGQKKSVESCKKIASYFFSHVWDVVIYLEESKFADLRCDDPKMYEFDTWNGRIRNNVAKKVHRKKKLCCKCATFFPEPNSSEWEAKQEKLSINYQLKKKKNIGVDNCEHLSCHWLFGQFMSESARIGTWALTFRTSAFIGVIEWITWFTDETRC